MAGEVAGAALFFAADRGHLLEILVVENDSLHPVEPGEAMSMTVETETFGVNV